MTSTPSTPHEPPTSKWLLREKTNPNKRKLSVPVQKSTGEKTGEKENHEPIWGIYSPKGIIPAAGLSRPVIILHDQLINVLDPHAWLTSDEMGLACYYMAQKHWDTDGFQSCLLFSALRRGGVVGTPVKPFVQ
ncbi:hypothetical protein AOLI_G00323580 [Acnodon oligacanthus]